MFDLTDWELVCDWGFTGLIFAKGNKRVLINKLSGDIIIEYDFKKGG